ncbi:hypothetical protein ACFSHT_32945 [Paraburkholderia silviterrae]|uniref:Uncharacterized protein n=1 Tax=Paraburkholderia silviterrae TaxID=2528715 RepID=A0A4R5LYG5_9BURK|nr:hypothetical protein [Paraburkholderia silviterrae]TDG17331.1 hypothetical protein EYW47_38235 [Paraburkholderia silviterrae]
MQQALKPHVFTESGFEISERAHRPGKNRAKPCLRLVRSNRGTDQACGVCLAAALRMSCGLFFHLLQENLIAMYRLTEVRPRLIYELTHANLLGASRHGNPAPFIIFSCHIAVNCGASAGLVLSDR